jgi:hypothetical protein
MPLKNGPSLYYNPKWFAKIMYYQNELLQWHSQMTCQPHTKVNCQNDIPKWFAKIT